MTKSKLLKTAKPILFNTEMVRAILEGKKTVTRRVVKCRGKLYSNESIDDWIKRWNVKPSYHRGDILYVRETWTKLWYVDPNGYTHFDESMYYYAADGTPDIILADEDGFELGDQRIRWRPSIHMPREAARIFLKVKDVRLERLQEITSDDIEREGIDLTDLQGMGCITRGEYVVAFQTLWNSTLKKGEESVFGWDANPYVFVISFERIEVDDNQ